MNSIKYTVLAISTVSFLVLLLLKSSVFYKICLNTSDSISCLISSETTFNLFIFAPVVLFFSLITFKLKPEVFVAWWAFAKFAIPVVLLGLLLINSEVFHGQTYGLAGWGDFFSQLVDMYATIAIYTIFVIGSLVQIYRGSKLK